MATVCFYHHGLADACQHRSTSDLLAFDDGSCTSRITSGSGLSGGASPSGTISLWWITLPGGASLRHLSMLVWFATTSLTSAFTWTRTSEWILRGL